MRYRLHFISGTTGKMQRYRQEVPPTKNKRYHTRPQEGQEQALQQQNAQIDIHKIDKQNKAVLMDFTQSAKMEEKLAEMYVETKELLVESAGGVTRRMFDMLGNTLLAQIQGTIYWMSRALIAERELEDLRDSLKAKRN